MVDIDVLSVGILLCGWYIDVDAKLSPAATTTGMTEDTIVGALRKIHFSNVRQYIEGLVKACEEFLDTSK